ncbi:hypothetical protein [Thioclava sp. DLFJ4-1]|uniref:hypothetical protein n=1 Tax=Thioclava sp. DLFJ4-1 TaxID=1915313 RepID=UPI000996109B|nr:hypothetical protein [Thioclava sp. DLFJ4-1]OOY15092.1 hypothetical protein BMI85_16225 [Thioclava sp. DLFJ4-1]
MTAYLYCIEAVDAGYAKVGVTCQPKHRLYAIGTTAPHEMKFRRLLLIDSDAVAYAHERCVITSANRYRDRGEWVVVDGHLDNLLDRVTPALDVTDRFDDLSSCGRKITSIAEAKAALAYTKRRERVLESQQTFLMPPRGASKDRLDRAIVLSRLSEGYGAEDVKVMDGIPVDFFWQVVREERSKQEATA